MWFVRPEKIEETKTIQEKIILYPFLQERQSFQQTLRLQGATVEPEILQSSQNPRNHLPDAAQIGR